MKIFTQKGISGSLYLDDKDKECFNRVGVILQAIADELDEDGDFDYIKFINEWCDESLHEFMYAMVYDTASVFGDMLEMWSEDNR